jgi:hypothetical protein
MTYHFSEQLIACFIKEDRSAPVAIIMLQCPFANAYPFAFGSTLMSLGVNGLVTKLSKRALHCLSGYMPAFILSQFRHNLSYRCLDISSNPLTDRLTV